MEHTVDHRQGLLAGPTDSKDRFVMVNTLVTTVP